MEVNTTENKTLEQDYRDLAGLLSNIVDSLPIYFFVKDTGDNFRYVYSSPLMNQLYGRYHNDVVGKTDFDLFLDPVVAQSFRDMDEEVVKTGKMQRFVEQMIDPKGILRTMDTMKLLAPREDKPPYLVGISWDITKQRQVEEELHSYNKRLRSLVKRVRSTVALGSGKRYGGAFLGRKRPDQACADHPR